MNFDTVLKAYIEAALWSSTDEEGKPLGSIEDLEISPELRASFEANVKDFLAQAQPLIEEAGISDEQVGHDFWLTRNRHGAGFWDRGLGSIGQLLTDIAHSYGEVDLYIGDDGLLYS